MLPESHCPLLLPQLNPNFESVGRRKTVTCSVLSFAVMSRAFCRTTQYMFVSTR